MRRRLWWGLARLAVVAAVAIVSWPQPPSRITRENFDRIREGMTVAEAEAILGPPGDLRTGETEADVSGINFSRNFGSATASARVRRWCNDAADVYVGFDVSGAVSAGTQIPAKRVTDNPLDNLTWRAKRQWHRWFPD